MIYFLDEDNNLRDFVLYALKNSGFTAEGFEKSSEVYKALEQRIPELLLMDVALSQEDGLAVLTRLRARIDTKTMPVIVVSARDTEYDKVIGLDAGADDYVTKPFGTMELIARVKALLRRTQPAADETVYELGNLSVFPAKHIVRASGREITLTLKEFELLTYLMKNRGNVLTRDQILQEIWGYEFDGENRTVDVHIRTLRSKLGDCGELIETVRGMGYRMGEK